jgi:hypothetical protein
MSYPKTQPAFSTDKSVAARTAQHYGAMATQAETDRRHEQVPITQERRGQAAGQSLQSTLHERGQRYGKFTAHAAVTQQYKRILTSQLADREKTLPDDQQEALEMIFHKIGRIVNGDNNYDDSWKDIAGYAELVAKRLQGTAL